MCMTNRLNHAKIHAFCRGIRLTVIPASERADSTRQLVALVRMATFRWGPLSYISNREPLLGLLFIYS